MNLERLKKSVGAGVLIIGLGLSAGFVILALHVPSYTSDFTVLWTAGGAAREILYDPLAMTAAQTPLTAPANSGLRPFAYPPSALLVFWPLAKLPFPLAYALWGSVLLIGFAAAARQYTTGWPLALVLASPPVVYGVWGGQPSILAGAVLLAAIPAMKTRPAIAGMVMGLVAAVKPQSFVLVPIALIAAREWRALVMFGVGGGIAALASLAFGPQLWIDWARSLPQFRHIVTDLGLDSYGVSPAAIAPALGLPAGIGLLIQGLAIVAGTLLVWRTWRQTGDRSDRASALLIGTILVSPYAMPYELAPLMPLVVAALLSGRLAMGAAYLPPAAKFVLPVAAMFGFLSSRGIRNGRDTETTGK